MVVGKATSYELIFNEQQYADTEVVVSKHNGEKVEISVYNTRCIYQPLTDLHDR